MELNKLVPWNWLKKEEEEKGWSVPVKRSELNLDISKSFYEIETEFERLFDSFKRNFNVGFSSGSLLKSDFFSPSMDIASNEKEYSVKVELPGLDKNNITIECVNNTLRIKGEKKEEKEKDYYRVERSYGSFERVLGMPDDADADKIESTFKDGILSVSIPKKALPVANTKSIPIKTAS
ncbi:MAG: Hsp20/alpha crystallin family protein [Campylobacterales bacterium]|nr:Hsp20/alpha crystallin family protein [Campylobacterales bacterium]